MCIHFYQIRIAAGVSVVELHVGRYWCDRRDGIVCGIMATNVEANRIVYGVYVQRHEFGICNAIGLYPFR